MYQRYGDKMEFIGICADKAEEIGEFVKKHDLSFPVAHDEGRKVTLSFGVRIPTHILIDKEGKIKYQEPYPPELEKFMKELHKEE